MILSRVDLPVPFPPTNPTRSCGVIIQSRFSNNNFWPNRLPAADNWIIECPEEKSNFYFRTRDRNLARATLTDDIASLKEKSSVCIHTPFNVYGTNVAWIIGQVFSALSIQSRKQFELHLTTRS